MDRLREDRALARASLALGAVGAATTTLALAGSAVGALLVFALIGTVTGFMLGVVALTGAGARRAGACGTALNLLVLTVWVAVFFFLARD
jgi:NADH:ubiquinone oxidoreductase subunit 6 (subunit J)